MLRRNRTCAHPASLITVSAPYPNSLARDNADRDPSSNKIRREHRHVLERARNCELYVCRFLLRPCANKATG